MTIGTQTFQNVFGKKIIFLTQKVTRRKWLREEMPFLIHKVTGREKKIICLKKSTEGNERNRMVTFSIANTSMKFSVE